MYRVNATQPKPQPKLIYIYKRNNKKETVNKIKPGSSSKEVKKDRSENVTDHDKLIRNIMKQYKNADKKDNIKRKPSNIKHNQKIIKKQEEDIYGKKRKSVKEQMQIISQDLNSKYDEAMNKMQLIRDSNKNKKHTNNKNTLFDKREKDLRSEERQEIEKEIIKQKREAIKHRNKIIMEKREIKYLKKEKSRDPNECKLLLSKKYSIIKRLDNIDKVHKSGPVTIRQHHVNDSLLINHTAEEKALEEKCAFLNGELNHNKICEQDIICVNTIIQKCNINVRGVSPVDNFFDNDGSHFLSNYYMDNVCYSGNSSLLKPYESSAHIMTETTPVILALLWCFRK